MKPLCKLLFVLFLSLIGSGCAAEKTDSDVVTIWHWMSDRDNTFQTLAERYREATGSEVKFELYAPSVAYEQKIKASVQTNTLPDVFGILGEKRDFGSFIKSGHVADLTKELSLKKDSFVWKDTLFRKALSVNTFLPDNPYGVPPGIYGVPLDVTTIQMVYNKELYRKAGLDPAAPPETWEQFLEHCAALKEAGIPCFVSGFGEIWLIDALATNFAMNIMGEEKVFATYRGEVPYTDPDWLQTFSIFKQMADEEILVPGTVTMVNKTAEQTFANGRAAYAFNGSWCVNVYRGMNPGLDYGAILPPKITNLHPMKIWGGAGSSLVVNAKSPRRDAAIRFLKWLTRREQQTFLSKETVNLPANKDSLSHITPILAEFADDMDNATHPNNYPVHEFPAVVEAFNKNIQSILIGEKSSEQAAAAVQKVKEKALKKKNKNA